ncbi:hypothetical protein [Rhodoplanes sp. Z2-YC6860]|uniref:hypothetical protein n=1 Tax=Rhodoplanes sp. Z2-YC6860 TaxID=674703 RepID=UPI000831258C|nr:hypothetical protein [Rhodoplanes sp. Z2-YC6860]
MNLSPNSVKVFRALDLADKMPAAFPLASEKLRRMMAEATSCSKWGWFSGEHAPQRTRDRVTLLGGRPFSSV